MEKNAIPNHVAVIMDGNGRWATKRGLKRSAGHLEGSKTFDKMVTYAFKKGIKVLSVYAFSTDNFKRSDDEVNYLMDLFIKVFKAKMKKIMKNDIKVVFSGRKEPLRHDVIDNMQNIMNESKNNKSGILNICLNYGGQEEIVDAVKKVVDDVLKNNISIEIINKDNFYSYLYNDLPPIDLMIRTSGEYRISNFLLYQCAYAEFYFTDTLFPDFDESKFDQALESYNKRDRRFGSTK